MMMIRMPVIPGVSADNAYYEQLRSFMESRKTNNIKEINLLPYHKTGSSKYRRFDFLTGWHQSARYRTVISTIILKF